LQCTTPATATVVRIESAASAISTASTYDKHLAFAASYNG
jgi:hypothetical protein